MTTNMRQIPIPSDSVDKTQVHGVKPQGVSDLELTSWSVLLTSTSRKSRPPVSPASSLASSTSRVMTLGSLVRGAGNFACQGVSSWPPVGTDIV